MLSTYQAITQPDLNFVIVLFMLLDLTINDFLS
jgi:hypothetical protein